MTGWALALIVIGVSAIAVMSIINILDAAAERRHANTDPSDSLAYKVAEYEAGIVEGRGPAPTRAPHPYHESVVNQRLPMAVDVEFMDGQVWRYTGWSISHNRNNITVRGRDDVVGVCIMLYGVRTWRNVPAEDVPGPDWQPDWTEMRLDDRSTPVVGSDHGEERPNDGEG